MATHFHTAQSSTDIPLKASLHRVGRGSLNTFGAGTHRSLEYSIGPSLTPGPRIQKSHKSCAPPAAFQIRSAHIRDFLGKVDAVIIARDDYETHFEMSKEFLEAGLPVFIDKPLSLEISELRFFRKYLESGQLMSCSGMRYARELDVPRASLSEYGCMKLIRGAIVLNWENYGVHLLDAIFGMISAHPISVQMVPSNHESAIVRLDDRVLIQLDAMGDSAPAFQLQLFGTKQKGSFDITDNFSMFRRMLWEFFNSIQTGRPAIPVDRTLEIMKVLISGRRSRQEKREVYLNELPL